MVKYFFYNKLTDPELIKKISKKILIYDGYIIIQNYDKNNNILEISDKTVNNNILLYGKIVDFDMNIYDVIKKINEIQELSLEHKTKYEFKEI